MGEVMNREKVEKNLENMETENGYNTHNGQLLTTVIFTYLESRNCDNCSVMNCKILGAVTNAETISLVDLGCNKWEQ